MKLSELKTDKDLEENGVWVPFASGMRVKIARLRNPRQQEFTRRHRLEMRDTTTPEGKRLFHLMVATTVLLDWDGLVDDDEKPIPYTPDKAIEVFKLSPDFLEDVCRLASERDLFRLQEVKEAEKN